jgi:hypothetical protein
LAEVKGRFITLTGTLMSVHPRKLDQADTLLMAKCGKHWNELDPDGWYDTSSWDVFMDAYVKASVAGEGALVLLGRNIYPTIKKAGGLPAALKTPLDLIKVEAEDFLAEHRGADVRPRKFIKAVDHDVVVEAPAPGYNSRLYEGVCLGILEICGVAAGSVEQTRSQEKGDPTSEFHIMW